MDLVRKKTPRLPPPEVCEDWLRRQRRAPAQVPLHLPLPYDGFSPRPEEREKEKPSSIESFSFI